MLTTLENMGYLQRSGTEYRLGLSVLRLGYDYLSTQPLAQLAEPVLQALCERLGFTTNLALLDGTDRKSTRLNSSHLVISYAVFCLKKKQNALARRIAS